MYIWTGFNNAKTIFVKLKIYFKLFKEWLYSTYYNTAENESVNNYYSYTYYMNFLHACSKIICTNVF